MTTRARNILIAASLLAFILLIANAGALLGKVKRLGKKQYYTQIMQPGLINGQAVWGYTYKQLAFDHDGQGQQLEFLADKSLRQQAYLRVYVSGEDRVITWEEVGSDAIPELALKQLSPDLTNQSGC